MSSGFGQAQERAVLRSGSEAMAPPGIAPLAKEIPYDYVAKFILLGEAGNRVQDVINISVEGAYVAVAIGYSFIPAKLPEELSPSEESPPADNGETPSEEPSILSTPSANATVDWLLTNLIGAAVDDPRRLAQCLVSRLCGIDFKYSIVDSGSGRELQNQSIHNIAGLGEPSGDRPFRPFAKPMLFLPRSTIRIEIEEISEGPLYGYEDPVTRQHIGAELFIVLHGYKVLGYGTALP
jgi:hypothetical protein